MTGFQEWIDLEITFKQNFEVSTFYKFIFIIHKMVDQYLNFN